MNPNQNNKETPMSLEQYNSVCKERFDEILCAIKDLKSGQEATHRRLFVDNGKESHQSRLNRHDRWIKTIAGAGIVVSTGIFGLVIWLIKVGISKHL